MNIVNGDDYALYNGDCLEVMATLEDNSVDCVIADIPYYKIMGDDWDNQWQTIEEYQAWIRAWAKELKRTVKNNGSIYIFTDEKVGAYVQVVLDCFFLLLNNLVWFKTNNLPVKNVHSLRSWAPMTERILFYTPQGDRTGLETVMLDVDNFRPLRDYFRDYQAAIGKTKREIIDTVGQSADHCFRWNSTQWELPTRETYEKLGELFPCEFLRRDYESLRRDYESLRREYESLRRTWNTDGRTLDVLVGGIITASENTAHPTTKPTWIIKRLIEASSNPGQTILDFTMGSGKTGVVCGRTGRKFIGIEINPSYFAIAETGIKNAYGSFTLTEKEKSTGQMSLF